MRVLRCSLFLTVFCYSVCCSSNLTNPLLVRFDRVDGLSKGAVVNCQGSRVGSVRTLIVDEEGVLVTIDLEKSFLVRSSDQFEITTPSLLGDKTIEVTRGPVTAPLVASGQILQGMVDPIQEVAVKALVDIITAAPDKREEVIESWRTFLKLMESLRELQESWRKDLLDQKRKESVTD
ncbi:MAG: MCE family protein [Acidobacteriota bacterium]